ncbi:MAG: NAD(P)/FAD-dependent oxidoreductase [Proteobacteria bacterium]|nr:NAD(P)/FAD-dependent oxidoreductase [Pseudomonadota bacterium]
MASRSSIEPVEHVDVLIVGAGITGIDAAYHLARDRPDDSFVVLEALADFGGTWRVHRYPGVRSDSDLFTFGYSFKPWLGAPVAKAPEILKYLGEVIEENGLADHIRYGHRISSASWSSADNVWTIEGVAGEGRPFRMTCGFLWMCHGYYRHGEGYTPDWPGMDNYKGRIVHPQRWPDDVDYRDKRVLVIGSGATAATVVPAIADDCRHVTMLQRSATYFFPSKNRHWLAELLRDLQVDERWVHEIVRRKIVADQYAFAQRALAEPDTVRRELLDGVARHLPQDAVDAHFTPTYRPWQQRIAVVPDGDLFECVRAGKASIVTGQIDRFVADGVRLQSGETLVADLVVTATGFNMSPFSDIAFKVDGAPVDFSKTVAYRGMMFTGVPNMLWVLGYFRAASWTLKADLVCAFVCRLLGHMQRRGARTIEVALRPEDEDMALLPWIDPETFNPGYLMRAVGDLPRRGDKEEWAHSQDYWKERHILPDLDLDDPIFRYDEAGSRMIGQTAKAVSPGGPDERAAN